MSKQRVQRLFENALTQAKIIAGTSLAAERPVRLGDPTTDKIWVDKATLPKTVYIHQQGEAGLSIFTAINDGLSAEELIMRAPILVKPTDKGNLRITGTDPDLYPAFIEGAATGDGQLPVNIGQLMYGTIQPDVSFEGVRYIIIGATYGDTIVDSLLTDDFATGSVNDINGNPISIPSTADTCNVVLAQVNRTDNPGAIEFLQTGEITDDASTKEMYRADRLPVVNQAYRIGYIKLEANKTRAVFGDVLHMPDFIRIGGSTVGALSDITDVDITTPAADDIIAYDDVNTRWRNTALNPLVDIPLSQLNDVDFAVGYGGLDGVLGYSATHATWTSVDPAGLISLPPIDNSICHGRITLTSQQPATIPGDSATIYFTPYNGNRIAIYNNSEWSIETFTETSLNISGLAASTNYDVYYHNSKLYVEAWADDSTSLNNTVVDGILVSVNDNRHRYVGSIRISSANTVVANSETCGIWNYYNQIKHTMRFVIGTGFNTTSPLPTRIWNNNSSFKIQAILGQSANVFVSLTSQFFSTSGGTVRVNLSADGSGNHLLSPLTTNLTSRLRKEASNFTQIGQGWQTFNATQQADNGGNFENAFIGVTVDM